MDLNRFYAQYQIALMHAERESEGVAKQALLGEANRLALAISRYQHQIGAPAARSWGDRQPHQAVGHSDGNVIEFRPRTKVVLTLVPPSPN